MGEKVKGQSVPALLLCDRCRAEIATIPAPAADSDATPLADTPLTDAALADMLAVAEAAESRGPWQVMPPESVDASRKIFEAMGQHVCPGATIIERSPQSRAEAMDTFFEAVFVGVGAAGDWNHVAAFSPSAAAALVRECQRGRQLLADARKREDQWIRDHDGWMERSDKAEEEVARLKQEARTLRDDLHRLADAQCTPLAVELSGDVDRLTAENARLRAALKRIASDAPYIRQDHAAVDISDDELNRANRAMFQQAIAREAIAAVPPAEARP